MTGTALRIILTSTFQWQHMFDKYFNRQLNQSSTINHAWDTLYEELKLEKEGVEISFS
jgi:uncharacterized membrane protein